MTEAKDAKERGNDVGRKTLMDQRVRVRWSRTKVPSGKRRARLKWAREHVRRQGTVVGGIHTGIIGPHIPRLGVFHVCDIHEAMIRGPKPGPTLGIQGTLNTRRKAVEQKILHFVGNKRGRPSSTSNGGTSPGPKYDGRSNIEISELLVLVPKEEIFAKESTPSLFYFLFFSALLLPKVRLLSRSNFRTNF